MGANEPTILGHARLGQLLDSMRGRRVVVVGDAMLDRYLMGDTERISPEAPVPVVTVTERRQAPGGAANVAANVAALGGEALLVAAVGTDRDGEALRDAMATSRLDGRFLLPLADRPTTVKTRVVARGQQVVRIDEEQDGPLARDQQHGLIALARQALDGASALVLEDYDKGVLSREVIEPLMREAEARAIPVVVDPKFRSFFHYAGATLFKPNRRELTAALPGIDPASPRELQQAAERLGVEHLLLTLGAEGMVLVSRGEPRPHLIRSQAREVFDVSGAGDTVTAAAGTALAAGASVVEAAELANLAASVEVGKVGVATVSPEEILGANEGR